MSNVSARSAQPFSAVDPPGLTNAERASLRDRLRRTAASRPFIMFMAVVALLAGLYYGVIATPMYVSETRFAVRSREIAAPSGFLSGLFGTPSGISDITAVSDYITSHDMLSALQKRVDLRSHYAQPRLDPLQWMSHDASEEAFVNFYRRHVIVKLDREADTVTVQVNGFDPRTAQQTASAVLELTEQFVNGMSQRLRDDTLASARGEYERALADVTAKRAAVTNFQTANSDLNPTATGGLLVSSIGALQSAAATAQNQLASLKTYARPDAPAVRQLQAQLDSINRQIELAKARQGGASNKAQQVQSFESLQLDRTTAETVLTTARAAYNAARASAEQREKFVVRIVTPNLPQKPTAPNRLLEFVTTMIFAMAGYALVSLSVAAIRDHQGI